jgi:hypothetical protein
MAVLGGLLGPLEFVSSVGSELLSGVSSIQGISGDLILAFPDYATVTESSTLAATLAFADPAARVTCPEVPDVFALGALTADSSGSATIQAGPCYKVIPSADPGSPNVLTITNICAPCTDCDDILTLQQKLTSQANYFYNLSAIYHNHFNRYQVAVAAANKTIGAVNSGADIVSPTGPITFVGRVINRPYFTQLYLAVVNNSEYAITVDLTVTIDPPELASQLVIQPESLLIQETLSTGVGFADSVGYSGFPGRTVFGVSPQDSVGYNSECKRMKMGSVTTGHWNMTAMVVFSTGPGTLPAVQTVTRTFTPAIALTGSPLVVI